MIARTEINKETPPKRTQRSYLELGGVAGGVWWGIEELMAEEPLLQKNESLFEHCDLAGSFAWVELEVAIMAAGRRRRGMNTKKRRARRRRRKFYAKKAFLSG